jgi:hypothetical protein
MGTTLTGTTPQDTYDSLIKVTDNGPLSGTLKALSDGLGNDSTLSLSTTAASIAGTLAVTGNAAFDTSTLFIDAAANEVGVGTASPAYRFNVVTDAIATRQNLAAIDRTAQNFVTFTNPQFSADASMGLLLRVFPQSDARQGAGLIASGGSLNGDTDLGLFVSQGSGSSTSYSALNIIGSSGNVGIGTSAPAVRLDVVGNIRSSTGILFGTDTAAANTLDDYEEGTWTMGVAFGGASVGVTYTLNTGTYTKIGRQVTVNGFIVLSSKGSSVGDASVTGLPFTIANTNSNYSPATLRLLNISFTNQFVGYGVINATTIDLEEVTILGVGSTLTNADFANNSTIMVSLTYFV